MWPETQVSGPFFKMSMPEISVIIPVYNRPYLLSEAVISVLDQTHSDFDILIVDDGSTDTTPETIKTLAAGDSRIKTLTLDHTGYAGLVRNRGAAQTDSRYLAFLDSDDFWLNNKLQLQRDQLAATGLKISHTREKWIRNGLEVSQAGQKHNREGYVFQEALKKCILGPSTVMLDRVMFEETGGFREDLEIAEDYELWIRMTALHPVCYLDIPLTVKKAGHDGQLSEKYGQIEIFRIWALQSLADNPLFSSMQRDLLAKELTAKAGIYAKGCRKRGRVSDALIYERLAQST
jgi:glycosyltransferase involved in cell wall biosynthesis